MSHVGPSENESQLLDISWLFSVEDMKHIKSENGNGGKRNKCDFSLQ